MMKGENKRQPAFRMTRQRRVILEELERDDSHPGAVEIYEKVKHRLPRISLGTVYRNLELLSREGLVTKIEVCGARRRFDGRAGEHYHVRCVRCGRVDDLAVGPLEELEERLRGVSDYEITGHRIEFVGICPTCVKSGTISGDETPQGGGKEEIA